MKIAIIGAGSTYTPELIEGVINRKEVFPVTEIALMDIDEHKLRIVGGLAARMVDKSGHGAKVTQTFDSKEALSGATFVFAQIRVGKLPARVLDEKIPLKYDLHGQETTGIGGFFKALRTIPVLVNICEIMQKVCPEAYLINFSNPSGICAQALSDSGFERVIGLCNAPIGMISTCAETFDLDPKKAEAEYIGLNHLSFVTGIKYNGKDYIQSAVHGDEEALAKLDWQMGFRAEEIKQLEAVPSYYLTYFLHRQESLKKQKEAKTSRGEDCMVIEKDLLAMYQDANLYVKPELLSKRGGAMYSEAACSLAQSIYLDEGAIHIVNTKNNGAITYLKPSDVVEVKAMVNKHGARSLTIPEIYQGSAYVRNIIKTIKEYENATATAALKGDKKAALEALLINPLIGDYQAAKACFDEMLEAHKEFLPQF